MDFNIWLAFVVMQGISCLTIGILANLVLKKRRQESKEKERRRQNILEDLNLATSEQLLAELRNRPGSPFVMLSPIRDDAAHGLTIEVHNVPPAACVSMLHMGATITMSELKKRGVEIDLPEFPSFNSEEEEDDEDE